MIIGFTGTRSGMTQHQRDTVRSLILQYPTWETHLHHGDCDGADDDFHDIGAILDVHGISIHPPRNSRYRAGNLAYGAGEMYAVADYMVRNQHIVNACDFLIATPREMDEQPRGGTWSTVRKAKASHKLALVVLPDGTIDRRDP